MKIFLRTFGCRANHYDTEAVRAMAEAAGHSVVAEVGEADVAVFNSCAVTAQAEAELRKVVRRAARERPTLRSVVMGCAAALDDARPSPLSIRALPGVSHVVAGADLPGMANALGVAEPNAIRTRAQSGARALLRIQDGCDEHCTFCATTLARGANRSRPIDVLVEEAAALSERHSEIVITGIHIGTYGRDAGTSLGALLQRLVRNVPVVRFRLSSIEATELDDAICELLIGMPDRLAPYVHAPLQSGSDRVLRRMGRHWYTAATYAHAVQELAARMSILGLGADVITGFPGETDADHAATLAMIDRLPFTYLHVFPYSPRPGTAARRLPDPVPEGVAARRAAELRDAGERRAAAHRAARDGGVADVVVVGSSADRQGITGDFLHVAVRGSQHRRGERFQARLRRLGERLVAEPLTAVVSTRQAQ